MANPGCHFEAANVQSPFLLPRFPASLLIPSPIPFPIPNDGQNGWAKKVEPETHDHNLSNLNRFKKITGRFLGKFVLKRILKIPPHQART